VWMCVCVCVCVCVEGWWVRVERTHRIRSGLDHAHDGDLGENTAKDTTSQTPPPRFAHTHTHTHHLGPLVLERLLLLLAQPAGLGEVAVVGPAAAARRDDERGGRGGDGAGGGWAHGFWLLCVCGVGGLDAGGGGAVRRVVDSR
jgi:uncharacterized membrane protein YgcG